MSSRRFTVFLAALSLLLVASCDRRKEADGPVLRFVNRGDVFTLDLNDMSYGQDIRVTYLLREGLYGPTGPGYTPKPANATGCDVTPDGLTYTFHLRPEAKWSNGEPVTAADYIFSWRYMLEQPGEYTYLFYYIRGAEEFKNDSVAGKRPNFDTVGIKALDPYTLRVTLKQPMTYFLECVAFTPFYPRNEKSMEPFLEKGSREAGRPTYNSTYTRPPNLVSNGPFALKDWKFKRVLKMVKNPYYWDAANIKLGEVDMVVNDNVLSTYLQFSAKAVDWVVSVPAEIGPDLKQQNAPGLNVSPSFGTEFLTANCKPDHEPSPGVKNPLADMRVRQALAMSIDKDFITQQVTRMGEEPATHYIPPGTIPGFTSLPGPAHDVERAQALLAEAGFPKGRGFPRVKILYASENLTRARIAQVLKRQWKEALGVDVEIDGVEGKNFTGRVSKRKFDIAMVAWYGDYLDVSTFTDKYAPGSIQNDASWFNKDFDELLNKAGQEKDRATRLGYLSKAESLLNGEAGIMPIYHYVNATLIGPRVSGIVPNPRGIIDWKQVTVQDVRP